MYQKLKQHPNLRDLFLGTGDAPIVYSEERETSWVENANEPGRALEKVRERLRREGFGPGNSGGAHDATPFASVSGSK